MFLAVAEESVPTEEGQEKSNTEVKVEPQPANTVDKGKKDPLQSLQEKQSLTHA